MKNNSNHSKDEKKIEPLDLDVKSGSVGDVLGRCLAEIQLKLNEIIDKLNDTK